MTKCVSIRDMGPLSVGGWWGNCLLTLTEVRLAQMNVAVNAEYLETKWSKRHCFDRNRGTDCRPVFSPSRSCRR